MRPQYLLNANSEGELDMLAAMHLERRGFTVRLPGETGTACVGQWETREEFCGRMGICERTLSRALQRKHPPVQIERGKLCASVEFEQWIRRRRRARSNPVRE